jgi:glutaredoxin 3
VQYSSSGAPTTDTPCSGALNANSRTRRFGIHDGDSIKKEMAMTMTSVTRALFLSALLLLISSVVVQGELLSTGEDVDSYVQKKIAGSNVMVFAKSYCPYCRHTRSLLQEVASHVSVDIVNLDELHEDGPLIQMELMTTTGQRTVPNIFIDGEHIGGDSDFSKLHESGELQEMLSKVKATY